MVDFVRAFINKYREIVMYFIVGVLTTSINYILYFSFTRGFGMTLVSANVFAWTIAVFFAYLANHRWVFCSASKGALPILLEIGGFFAVRILSGFLDTGCLVLLTSQLNMDDMVAKVFVGILVIAFNYICSKLMIFKSK